MAQPNSREKRTSYEGGGELQEKVKDGSFICWMRTWRNGGT